MDKNKRKPSRSSNNIIEKEYATKLKTLKMSKVGTGDWKWFDSYLHTFNNRKYKNIL